MKSQDGGCISSHCHVFHRPPHLATLQPLWFITQAGKGYRPPDPRGSLVGYRVTDK